MTSFGIVIFAVASGRQKPMAMQAHGLGHDKPDYSASRKAVGAAGIKPADLLRRKENRDGMHDFGRGLAKLSDFG
jgi:hypothetical protein